MPDTVSHYRLEAEIGRGGMGVVYRAVDTRLGRPAAIKMLAEAAIGDADRNRRFVQEARSASALNHPNIVTIYEIGEEAGATFVAMELVDGTPLDVLLARGPLPVSTALDYAVHVAAGLEAAHAAGVVHRDIKPANIIITRDGRAKILDFGLAKLVERAPAEATMSAVGTQPGLIMGTAAYMSPEQAEGRPVDARSDIFSFGAVLYEVLSGRRPFAAASELGVLSAILRVEPPPLRSIRVDVPADLDAIVQRCLAKDPAGRYVNGGAVRTALATAHARLARPADAVSRRPAVLIPLALLLVAAVAFGIWQTLQITRARWVREEAIPEIERLQATNTSLQAVRLARQVEAYAPAEIARIRETWLPFNLATEPDGADVEVRNYLDLDGAWEQLGETPVRDYRLPFGQYRVRITKPGYTPVEVASPALGRPLVTILTPDASAVAGMVPVPGGMFGPGSAAPVTLPDYLIDRLEVTNAEFKRFVDARGYRDPTYWKETFRDGDRVLPFDEAMARFRDATGRVGPSTWELETYPEGQADFPVGGVSWFEAAAYAEFAGKSLPTVYHWFKAAVVDDLSSDILRLSNFDGDGPVAAGVGQGLGRWGTLDMAGNIKEWCANVAHGTGLRYILGGGWNEPAYRFAEADARDPWDRPATFGIRLVKNLGAAEHAAIPLGRLNPDPQTVVPVSSELLDVYRRFYAYDRTPLDVRADSVDDSSPNWRKETLSFDAAYGGERVPAHLFLPKTGSPPYQTVVFFPSAYARIVESSEHLDLRTFDFIIRSGRALLYPIYQGTFERRMEPSGPSGVRDLQVQWAKDFFRAVDYLETRDDIDMNRLGYYSLSMGAFFGPIVLSQEPRIKAAVLSAGGLRYNSPPEVQPANFSPRVTIPVLLVNGRDDFGAPVEVQRRVLELLGTPAEHKRRVQVDGGHVPHDMRVLIREALDWYDKYLGPVQ